MGSFYRTYSLIKAAYHVEWEMKGKGSFIEQGPTPCKQLHQTALRILTSTDKAKTVRVRTGT